MNISRFLFCFIGYLAIESSAIAQTETPFKVLSDLGTLSQVFPRDMTLKQVEHGSGTITQIESGHEIDWPGITFKPHEGFWDGTGFQQLACSVTNQGEQAFEIGMRVDNPGGDGQNGSVTTMSYVQPGQTHVVTANIYDSPLMFSKPVKLHGMHASPGQQAIDPTKIEKVILFLRTPSVKHKFTVDNLRLQTPMAVLDADTFFPFIDQYGQFIHDDWPGKIDSDEQLTRNRETERKELAKHPGPSSFGKYGGWKGGPKHEPGRFFRTEKHDGKWWLIDPDGHRFWSHGIDAVSMRFGGTGVQDRENYFLDLPAKNTPLGAFYSMSTWGMGFYGSRIPFETYNFYTANLYRKYGEGWRDLFADTAHRRLRSWGMNTLASWADSDICLQRRTPYTAFFRAEKCPVLEGAEKRWTKFADVFDPKFREAVMEGIDSTREAVGDPWCIGFYVDNELYWGNQDSFALWTLACPAKQYAKQQFVHDLKSKYESIEKLNEIWGTEHENWDELVATTKTPDPGKAAVDLQSFSKKFVETYFGTVKEELAKAAPGQLYLGCRFIWSNEIAVRAACEFSDVVSFNCYQYSAKNLGLPIGEDRPIMIGEFHFGALDRGMFHPSKVPARDQQHRGECYKEFLRSALSNPLVIGTHWFQYASEPTAGRGDGENYQVGFVDNCDTPYHETVEAAREIGSEMYRLRSVNE